MSLLTTSETKKLIAKQVATSTDTLQIISAYCKTSAIQFIEDNIHSSIKDKKIMVRFLLSDIIQGATDFSLYEFCKSNNWKMYIKFDLHAKTYIFDKKRCILGSANLTSNGMGLNFYGNYELSSFTEIDKSDLVKIDKLFNNAILMNDTLYNQMKLDYEKAKQNNFASNVTFKWGLSIAKLYTPKIDALFTYDFPTTPSPNFNALDGFEFLEFNHIPSIDEAKEAFRWCKSFLWLYNFISNTPDKASYFGAITTELHNTLINDPKPYRKEVKELLANTLGWIQSLKIDEIIIDIPSHSQLVKIKE